MSDLKFTKDHEWVKLEGNVATFGITHHAQQQLGDVVFVELPKIGKTVHQGDEIAVVESVKAASEVYAPLSGVVQAVNDALSGQPGHVNADPEGAGWFAKITVSNSEEFSKLMSLSEYEALL